MLGQLAGSLRHQVDARSLHTRAAYRDAYRALAAGDVARGRALLAAGLDGRAPGPRDRSIRAALERLATQPPGSPEAVRLDAKIRALAARADQTPRRSLARPAPNALPRGLATWRMRTAGLLPILDMDAPHGAPHERRNSMTTVTDLSNALAGAVERASKSMVAVHGRPRVPSTGVLWRAGLVVTANHTVETDGDVPLTGPGGERLSARVAGRDGGLDIAVLRADASGLTVADVADDGELCVGHLVLALGAGPRASAGIVSALSLRGAGKTDDALAVDLTLYPGFSGGPLIDVAGRVVGVTTSGASRHLQCAVRASAVSRLVEQVVRTGRIPRAYLGVATQPVELPEQARERFRLAQRTAVIAVNVRPDGPAAAAGLMLGDVIVSVGGVTIAEPGDLLTALRPDRVGGVVAVSILRGGEPRELRVTVGERPSRA